MIPFSPSKNWRERGFQELSRAQSWIEKPGCKRNYARRAIQNRFKLTDRQMKRVNVQQIVRCEYTSAIRLLLGCSA